ncbi:MAG: helix-turn-helix transcriptional regulator [Clostridia bacterium]|nr:helix-turn-helix transcriptional regulator [Clostridia bacterium]
MSLDLSAIGNFIQKGRKHYNMTQAELATKLNISPQSVSNWERGESVPDVALLPDLACVLHCSVDAILAGGNVVNGYRRYVTFSQMCEALSALIRMGELLGRDHRVYTTIIDAINTSMNTTIEDAFADPNMFEMWAGEFLIGCIRNGDYVDPRDVMANMKSSQWKEYTLNLLDELGIR